MKIKIHCLVFILLICSFINISAQDQNYSFKLESLSINANRAQVLSGLGEFSLSGTDENGNAFSRQATSGTFSSSFVNCVPCRKNTVFAGTVYTDTWITGGTSQGPREWADFNGLKITVPDWSVPFQTPFFRPIVKYVPVRIAGTLRVIDSRPGTYRIIYTATDVNLSGFMRVEFIRSFLPNQIEWRKVEIVASEG